jgi:hemerythrin HHE cation binding domain-containing protein
MNDPMTILKADHREAKQMMTALAETEEGDERNAMEAELDRALSLHMALEEEYVYPLVAELVGAEDEEEAEIEHGLAREALDKLGSMVEMPGFGAVVEMLKGGILHHVEEEETEILPGLKEAMTREEWLALGDALASAKADAGSPTAPPRRRRSTKRSSTRKKG